MASSAPATAGGMDQEIVTDPTQQVQSNFRTFVVCGIKFTVPRKYKLIKPIGHGAYGVVCSAQNQDSGEHVAIKKITKSALKCGRILAPETAWRLLLISTVSLPLVCLL
jgi:serine/threonine protein kinase